MNIKTLLDNFHKAQEELQETLRKDGKKLLEESFKELFADNEGLKAFAFKGYTPSFNDGEECYHSDEFYLGKSCYVHRYKDYYGADRSFWSNDWDDDEDLSEFFITNEDFDFEDTSEDAVLPILINKDCKDFDKAASDVSSFATAIEMVYDTNYLVLVRLEDDGSVSVEHKDYDCGY